VSNWKFLRCFLSRETIRQGETSGHRSGGLVSVLASGTSTCPKNARDLTVSTNISNIKVLEENYTSPRRKHKGKSSLQWPWKLFFGRIKTQKVQAKNPKIEKWDCIK
jgi:hypothetical protein